MMKSIKSFTLIELLIVIVIIGILATALIPRLKGVQGKARDTQRLADLIRIQTALELYQADNSNYPTTTGAWRGNCSSYGVHPTSGVTGYVPNLAPQYIDVLPLDPKPQAGHPGSCYLYKSNGIDYILLANVSIEGKIPPELMRLQWPTHNTYAIYTPGAKMW